MAVLVTQSVAEPLTDPAPWAEMVEAIGDGIPVSALLASVLASAAILGILWVHRWLRSRRPIPMDRLEGNDFERYCAKLLERNGFEEVRVTVASHDFGADILAERDGVTYAVQCKRYDRPVGVAAVQEVYAARDYYGRMVGAVMTNAEFTPSAEQMAKRLRILLWDRLAVQEMER